MQQPTMKTAGGFGVWNRAAMLDQPTSGIIEGPRAFHWKRSIDDAVEGARRIWRSTPVVVVEPRGLSRHQDYPPRWRITAFLESWQTIAPCSEDICGARLIVVLFSESVLDEPLQQVVAAVVSSLTWAGGAADWSL